MATQTVEPGAALGRSKRGYLFLQRINASTDTFVFKLPNDELFEHAVLQVNGTWNSKTLAVKESQGNSYSEALQDSTPASITFTADAVKILLSNRPCKEIHLVFSDATGVDVTAILVAKAV